jgi:hypothetical protein
MILKNQTNQPSKQPAFKGQLQLKDSSHPKEHSAQQRKISIRRIYLKIRRRQSRRLSRMSRQHNKKTRGTRIFLYLKV